MLEVYVDGLKGDGLAAERVVDYCGETGDGLGVYAFLERYTLENQHCVWGDFFDGAWDQVS